MTRAFIGIAIGIVCGLLWGNATTESGATIPLAIPLGVIGGAAGALWGAASPDAVAIPVLAGILALIGAAVGRRLGRASGEPAEPSAWHSWPYRRTAVGAGIGVLLGLAWAPRATRAAAFRSRSRSASSALASALRSTAHKGRRAPA